MLTSRTLLLFLFALIQAFAAVMIAEHWVSSKSENTEVTQVERISHGKVIVAARDIAQWKRLEASHIKEVEWPEDAIPPNAFTELSQVIGKVAIDTIHAGEALNSHRILEAKGGSVFALLIGENKRALTIRVNDVSGVAGFLRPGNRVDILYSTSKMPGLGNQEVRAETVVRNLKILAIDQDAENETTKPEIVRSITLETTPQEAEAVLKADEGGSIRLALRNPADDFSVQQPNGGDVQNKIPPAENVVHPYTIIRGTTSRDGKCDHHACTE